MNTCEEYAGTEDAHQTDKIGNHARDFSSCWRWPTSSLCHSTTRLATVTTIRCHDQEEHHHQDHANPMTGTATANSTGSSRGSSSSSSTAPAPTSSGHQHERQARHHQQQHLCQHKTDILRINWDTGSRRSEHAAGQVPEKDCLLRFRHGIVLVARIVSISKIA